MLPRFREYASMEMMCYFSSSAVSVPMFTIMELCLKWVLSLLKIGRTSTSSKIVYH
jgi:hypothetical protein